MYDIFISFKNLDKNGEPTHDSVLAREVFDRLSACNFKVFFSPVSLEKLGVSAYKAAIDAALDSSSILVAVGTSPENLNARWVRHEWDSFHNDILDGVKPEGKIFVYVTGCVPNLLPRTLRQSQVFFKNEGGLEKLVKFITNSLPNPNSSVNYPIEGTEKSGYQGESSLRIGPGVAHTPLTPLENDPTGAELVVLDDTGKGFRDDPSAWPAALSAPVELPLLSGPFGTNVLVIRLEDDPVDAGLVIIDDAGKGFRDDPSAWPAALSTPGIHPLVILIMSQPLFQGSLWEMLIRDHADRLVVVVSTRDLVASGVRISRGLSWERTVGDIARQLAYNPSLRPLAHVATLVIQIEIDGVLVVHPKEDNNDATFLFDPTGYEGPYKELYPSDMQGLTPAFVTALAQRLATDGIAAMTDGVRDGIFASRRLFRLGYRTTHLASVYPPEFFGTHDEVDGTIEQVRFDNLQILEDDPHWTILHHLERAQLEKIASQIVRDGIPALQKVIPVARFNNLVVVDRDEIESYRSIRNLLQKYVANAGISTPFSFAVFGPPGSGKSFGVSELSKGLTSEQTIEPFTFNLSLFESPSNLVGAFRLVHDSALKGELPLVFFDEFDARLGTQPLGWLRYFLAPMQDGVFPFGESIHPIGRAVFVFTGGTSVSFDEFAEKVAAQSTTEMSDTKGIDFISRLRGRIDIRGCNPVSDNDDQYIVRRALLLRSILERTAPHLVAASGCILIDPSVLRAFLKVPTYRHGVRSMQAIVEMSTLTDQKTFAPASIPLNGELALHVDAEIFHLLMLQDVLFERMVEPLAQAIHREYLAHVKAGTGVPTPTAVPWDDLTEEFRDSNRNQAREIQEKLRTVNCGIMPKAMPKAMGVARVVTAFTDEQVELLSKMEHDRWMAEKLRKGWVAGTPRNDDKKIHPDLVPWEVLPEQEKEKDRNSVRTIPKFLANAGFAIYPLP